jgi:hypothetical protein
MKEFYSRGFECRPPARDLPHGPATVRKDWTQQGGSTLPILSPVAWAPSIIAVHAAAALACISQTAAHEEQATARKRRLVRSQPPLEAGTPATAHPARSAPGILLRAVSEAPAFGPRRGSGGGVAVTLNNAPWPPPRPTIRCCSIMAHDRTHASLIPVRGSASSQRGASAAPADTKITARPVMNLTMIARTQIGALDHEKASAIGSRSSAKPSH